MKLQESPAFRIGLSIAIATGLYGLSFGALSVASGLSVWQTIALSLLMFTGGSQFAFIGVVAGGGTGSAAFGAAALLGVRNAVYGMQMKWAHARSLALSIAKAAGWMTASVLVTTWAVSTFKALTAGKSTLVTAIPQGAAAGYGSYIVGEAARYYFENGASWGNESPKAVVQRILSQTDKQSVMDRLKGELLKKLQVNPYAAGERGASAP